MPNWTYYTLAVLLVLLNGASAASNLVSIPGNWIIVIATGLFAWLVQTATIDGVSFWVVGALLVLATIGEATEMLASSVGAARVGASRRGITGALIGSLGGSIVGAIVGFPVPLIGSAIGAMIGGALGAFAGAALAEKSSGRANKESVTVGLAAMLGKIFGTAGKVIVGVVMFVVATFDVFL